MSTLTSAQASEASVAATPAHKKHTGGLLLVGLFKLSKAIFFGVLGAGALHMLHHDVGGLIMRITDLLQFDSESRLVHLLQDQADLIGNHQLRQFSIFALGYSVVCVVEGVGLVLEKTWAEYFTVILTVGAMPWEIFELCRKPSWFSLALLLANIAILLYLVWFLRRKGLLRRRRAAGI